MVSVVAIGLIFSRPEWITWGIIIIIVMAAVNIFKNAMPQMKLIINVARLMIIAATILAVLYFPYIFTPGFLAKEISIEDLNANFNDNFHRKIKVRGWITNQENSSFHIGSDQMVNIDMEGDEGAMTLSYDANSVSPQPKIDEKVLVTGVIRSYGGSRPRFIATDLDFIDEPPRPVTLDDLYNLKNALEDPEQAESLTLSERRLIEVPGEITKLVNLEKLDIHGTGIQALPPGIGTLTNLNELSLGHNRLTDLPPELEKLSRLKKLRIHNNRFTKLPEVIIRLFGLTRLSASENMIESVPSQIHQLSELTHLFLKKNKIREIPNTIGLLEKLRHLDLSDNLLTTVPVEIGYLPDLTDLDLSGNQLSELPDTIGNLSRLNKLDLSGNPLSDDEKSSITNQLSKTKIKFGGKTPEGRSKSKNILSRKN